MWEVDETLADIVNDADVDVEEEEVEVEESTVSEPKAKKKASKKKPAGEKRETSDPLTVEENARIIKDYIKFNGDAKVLSAELAKTAGKSRTSSQVERVIANKRKEARVSFFENKMPGIDDPLGRDVDVSHLSDEKEQKKLRASTTRSRSEQVERYADKNTFLSAISTKSTNEQQALKLAWSILFKFLPRKPQNRSGINQKIDADAVNALLLDGIDF